MRCLVVLAHPLPDSLNGGIARLAMSELEAAGHEVQFLDLYRDGFDPRLSPEERAVHYDGEAARAAAPADAALLEAADALVLVFPTWWFGLPAILKGWIDRTFAPGVAYDHAETAGGPIRPRLDRLRHFVVLTTLGSPWWIDTFLMWQPVRRNLRHGLMRACAPKARFAYVALHGADAPGADSVADFEARVRRTLAALR